MREPASPISSQARSRRLGRARTGAFRRCPTCRRSRRQGSRILRPGHGTAWLRRPAPRVRKDILEAVEAGLDNIFETLAGRWKGNLYIIEPRHRYFRPRGWSRLRLVWLFSCQGVSARRRTSFISFFVDPKAVPSSRPALRPCRRAQELSRLAVAPT